jgi:hypothetical protein
MKQKEIIKKIGTILKELQDQHEFIEKIKEPINDLELELFVANGHFLNDHIEITEKFFEPVVQPVSTAPAERKETLAEDADFELADEITHEEPIIRHELRLEDIENPNDEDEELSDFDDMDTTDYNTVVHHDEKEIAPPIEPEPILTAKLPKPAIIEEPVTTENGEKKLLTINQTISAQMAQSSRFADQLPSIKDLKPAINLNDKMLYVKDLFNGYSLSYSEAIDILNRCNTFEEANQFLQNGYAAKNNWADKQSTVDKFYGLLKRRFS